jgi:hypothetical protein
MGLGSTDKREWESPTLTTVGTLEELTAAGAQIGTPDGIGTFSST